MIEILVYQATIATSKESFRLTKRTAQQFPIDAEYGFDRARDENRPSGLVKVTGKTLGVPAAPWLILVEDPLAGLRWILPVWGTQSWMRTIEAQGGTCDPLEEIPMVIL